MATHKMSDPGSLCSLKHKLTSPVYKGQSFEGGRLYGLGSKESATLGYQESVVKVFMNREFLLFFVPGTENCGNKILWSTGEGFLSLGFFIKAPWIFFLGIAIFMAVFEHFPLTLW